MFHRNFNNLRVPACSQTSSFAVHCTVLCHKVPCFMGPVGFMSYTEDVTELMDKQIVQAHV